MDELERRLRGELSEIAGHAPTAPTLIEELPSRLRRLRHRQRLLAAGVTLAVVLASVGLVGVLSTNGRHHTQRVAVGPGEGGLPVTETPTIVAPTLPSL